MKADEEYVRASLVVSKYTKVNLNVLRRRNPKAEHYIIYVL